MSHIDHRRRLRRAAHVLAIRIADKLLEDPDDAVDGLLELLQGIAARYAELGELPPAELRLVANEE